MTELESLTRPSRADERRFVRRVSEWLVSQTRPDNPVVWRPNWRTTIPVAGTGSLRALLATLPEGEFAGLRRQGSSGPWAQVRGFEDRGEHPSGWPFELHPHSWTLGVPEGVWKLIGSDVGDVAALLWMWVTTGTPPADHPQPTAHPRPRQIVG